MMRAHAQVIRGWTVGGVALLTALFATQMYVWVNWWPISIGWLTALAWSLPQVAVWLLLAPAALALARRFPLDAEHRGSRIIAHALASIAFGAVGILILDASDRALGWATLIGAPKLITHVKYTVIHVHWGTAIYWVLLGADHTFRYAGRLREREARAAELEGELSRATLATLRMQLNPHFLFNTLNSIAVLLRRDAAAAEETVQQLSAFLRNTLEAQDDQLAPLGAELDRVRDYLRIEERRFGDRLAVRVTCPPDALAALVPTWVLQPLVENALRHGVAPQPGDVTLELIASRERDRLRLIVRDDGAGLSPRARDGVGLSATRRRLALLFGDAASLQLTSRAPRGTEAVVDLPWRTNEIAA